MAAKLREIDRCPGTVQDCLVWNPEPRSSGWSNQNCAQPSANLAVAKPNLDRFHGYDALGNLQLSTRRQRDVVAATRKSGAGGELSLDR